MLAAAYFGSLAGALERGRYDFVGRVRRHFVPFLGFTVLPMVVLLPLALLGLANHAFQLPAMLLLVPVFIIAAYLFYATPYLIALRDAGLRVALEDSSRLAVPGGPFWRYALGYAGFVLAVSSVATAVVVNRGLVGVAVGAVAAAPVGLAANAATMRFVADVDAASPSLGDWDD